MWNSQYTSDYLMHHGILGMKWGIRRYQNEDGSLTPAGKRRYEDAGASNPLKRINEARLKSARKAISKDIDSLERTKNAGMSEEDRQASIKALKTQRDEYDKKLAESSKTSSRDTKSGIKEGLRKVGNKVEDLENKIAKNNWTTGKKLATGAVESIGIYKIGQKVTTDLALSGHGVLATATSLGTYYAIYKNAIRISKK